MMNSKLTLSMGILLWGLILQVFIYRADAQLTAKDVSDGPCLPMPEVLPHLHKGVDLLPILTPGDYYIPMASQALYRDYAEALLGRPAANQEELDAMHLVLRCGPSFSAILNMGFPYMENPPSFGQTCISSGLPSLSSLLSGQANLDYVQAVCIGLPASRPDGSIDISASPSFVSTFDGIIWVNSDMTILLTYRCPSSGIKDYKVVSKSKTLSSQDIETIKEKIALLGFSEDHIEYMKYDDDTNNNV